MIKNKDNHTQVVGYIVVKENSLRHTHGDLYVGSYAYLHIRYPFVQVTCILQVIPDKAVLARLECQS